MSVDHMFFLSLLSINIINEIIVVLNIMRNKSVKLDKANYLELPYFNLTNYPLSVKGQLEKIPYDEKEAELLRYHQFVVKEFFTRNPHQRGILICHGMGQGKTRLAVAISTHYRSFDSHRKIIVLSAKSLEANFRKEVISYTGKNDDYVSNNYKFVSLNASNMFRQISNVDKSQEEIELEKKLGNFMDDVVRDSSLENSLLIIDEAHNLFNSITNGAKNAVALYDLIMETKNIKLIFMSGTPIINSPFELIPCYNMLKGQIILDDKTGGKNSKNYYKKSKEKNKRQKSYSEYNNSNVYGGDEDNDEPGDEDNDEPGDEDNDEPGDEDNDNKSSIDIYDNEPDESEIKTGDSYEPITDITNEDNSDIQDNTENTHDRFNKKLNRNQGVKRKKISNRKKKDLVTTLFSEDIDEFEQYFVDKENKSIKNKDKFTNRIYGLTSYYGDIYFPSTKDKPGFPKELDTIIEKVSMSQHQFARYMSARILEQDETKRGYRSKESRFSSSSGGSSTYRVKSRQISNYCIPEYALGPARGSKSREKFISKIKIEDLQNLEEFSPKMHKIIQNIEKHGNQQGIIYSQFVSGEGIAIFARVLQAFGYKSYGDSASDEDVYGIKNNTKQRTFAILSGEISPEERLEIINKFNSKENKDGSIIGLLLLSGAVAEGIDLKRIRHVHIMEPFWNYARISQVKTRAIRYLSHEDLPENERNVRIYIYLSDYPIGYPKNKITENTTDIDLYNQSINNMQIIDTFMQALAEASIDCSLHYPKLDDIVKERIRCKLCSPDNNILYHPLLKRDMELPSTCKPYSEQKVRVNEIMIPDSDEKFFYRKTTEGSVDGSEQIKLYHFNKKLNGYAPLLRTHPLYGDIMEAIVLKEG